MTSSAKTTSEARLGTSALCSAAKAPALVQVPAAIGSQATVLRTRRGQALSLSLEGGETIFIVRSGLLTLQITLPGSSRQIVAMLFSGDVFRSSFAPPHAEAALVAAVQGEISRMRLAALETAASADPAVRHYLDQALASRLERQAIHAATLGQFDCEQRVATFFIELALRTGVSAASGGVVFELPFNRKDIADYLGLNPDTLSRIMSRFKAAGLIAHSDRNRAVVHDVAALAARTPAARALVAISAGKPGEASLHACV